MSYCTFWESASHNRLFGASFVSENVFVSVFLKPCFKCFSCFVQKVQVELEGLKKDVNNISVRSQEVLASPQPSASVPVLRSELELTVQKMDHAYMLSSIYLDK